MNELTLKVSELEKRLEQVTHEAEELQTAVENYALGFERIQRFLANAPIPVIGCDTGGNIFEVNEAASRAFGFTLFEAFEQPISDYVFNDGDRAIFDFAAQECIENDCPVKVELPTLNKGCANGMWEFSITPMRGKDGAISNLIITAVDINNRVLEQQRLSELAFKDALTGLLNRRAFMELFSAAHYEITEEKPLGVILMDLDKFKSFNDTHGHPAGDQLLKRTGEILQAICGEQATPARYGGEEFIIAIPGCTEELGWEIAEKIRKGIEEQTPDLYGGATTSLGLSIAVFGEDITPEQQIQCADIALYAAKHGGRNQVKRYQEHMQAA